MTDKVKALIGKRVRVKRGSGGWGTFCNEESAMWCAGNVPVGSTGTIVEDPDRDHMVQIVWDHGQKPKPGYTFGLDRISHELEEIVDG